MREDENGYGWFAEGQFGDRTLAEQMVGLDPLLDMARGKTVLDLGCAEGLIALELMKAGAAQVHGIDRVTARVEKARKAFAGRDAAFWRYDLDRLWRDRPDGMSEGYDVVLLLSIIHKFPQPARFIDSALRFRPSIVAIRLPARVLIDERSASIPYDIPAMMERRDYEQCHDAPGPRGEWVGIFRR